MPHQHPVNQATHDSRTFGQRAADIFTAAFGTWVYIIAQTAIIVAWMFMNGKGVASFDPYPFILLNLGFSAQASYAAPLILMAQNRSSAVDRLTLEHNAQETEQLFQLQQTQMEILNKLDQMISDIHILVENNDTDHS